MSQAVIFQIGAVVFVAVTAAVFLYGMSVFREWQDRDDTPADVGDAVDMPEGSNVVLAPDEAPAKIVLLDHAPNSGTMSRPSAA